MAVNLLVPVLLKPTFSSPCLKRPTLRTWVSVGKEYELHMRGWRPGKMADSYPKTSSEVSAWPRDLRGLNQLRECSGRWHFLITCRLMMSATEFSWCSQVVWEVLAPWCGDQRWGEGHYARRPESFLVVTDFSLICRGAKKMHGLSFLSTLSDR